MAAGLDRSPVGLRGLCGTVVTAESAAAALARSAACRSVWGPLYGDS